jgi:hypothetical protein
MAAVCFSSRKALNTAIGSRNSRTCIGGRTSCRKGAGVRGGPVRTCALVDVSLAGDGDCVFFEEKAVECAGIPPVFDHVPEIDFADAVDVVPESM